MHLFSDNINFRTEVFCPKIYCPKYKLIEIFYLWIKKIVMYFAVRIKCWNLDGSSVSGGCVMLRPLTNQMGMPFINMRHDGVVSYLSINKKVKLYLMWEVNCYFRPLSCTILRQLF